MNKYSSVKIIICIVFVYLNFIQLVGYAQIIIGQRYINKEAGLTLNVDKDWNLSIEKNVLNIFNKAKGELITFHVSKLSSPNTDGFRNISKNDMDNYKNLLIKKYKNEGNQIERVEVYKSKFLSYYSLNSVALLSGQSYLGGIPIYKRETLFVIKPYYEIGFIYFIPQVLFSKNEISNIEKQVLSLKISN